jgi:aspartate/methionine/tyrosine aminotransferase
MKVVLQLQLTTGMFSAFAAFLDEGDEVIVMEPYFDQVFLPRFVHIVHLQH